MSRVYWEDFYPGKEIDLGEYEVTRDEILEFARRYDPQPFQPTRRRPGSRSTEGSSPADGTPVP